MALQAVWRLLLQHRGARAVIGRTSKTLGLGLRPRLAASAATGILRLAPSDVSGLIGHWDAFDSSTYDAVPELVGIADQGPNGWDLVPDAVGPVRDTYDINGSSAFLPRVVGWQEVPEIGGLAVSLNDFTLMAWVPTGTTHLTNTCYFALQATAFAWSLQLLASGTPGALAVQGSGGLSSFVLDVGFDASAPDGHALLFLRRSGGTMVGDVWHDKRLGGGLVHPAQVTGASVCATPTTAQGIQFGGRGSITQFWVGDPLGSAALFERAISDSELIALANGLTPRLGLADILAI